MASKDVIVAAIVTVCIARGQGNLVPKQEAMVRKLDTILQGVGINTKAITEEVMLDTDTLRASGLDVDALAADLRLTMLQGAVASLS